MQGFTPFAEKRVAETKTGPEGPVFIDHDSTYTPEAS